MVLNQKPKLKKNQLLKLSPLNQEVVAVWKPTGLTPLQAIDSLRKEKPEYANQKIGYAGRLDPLAEGVLLLMIGGANKRRLEYLNLKKTYNAKVLFGVATDSHDVLGKVENISNRVLDTNSLKRGLVNFEGSFIQAYPAFSSPRLAGHKNFSKRVHIDRIELLKTEKMFGYNLKKKITSLIDKVEGNFRQTEILADWQKYFINRQKQIFTIATIRVDCSAGVYIRLLAHSWGLEVGTLACLLGLSRSAVGDYSLKDCVKL
jgi:tRNA pseudouridine55 synthase